jgi:hypothetical protein
MGRRRTLPAVDEIRCPECRSIDWLRLGERISEVPADGDGRPMAQHASVDETGPWDWTCQRCGYSIKAGSHLDHVVGKVQSHGPLRTGVLAWLGGARERLQSAGAGAQAAVAGGLVVAVVVAVGALALTRPTDGGGAASPPASATSAPVASALGDLTSLMGVTDAATVAGQSVQLDDVRVQAVTGDVTFWVGKSRTERLYVVLDESVQGEDAVTVRDGQRVALRGTVQRTPVDGADPPEDDRDALADEVLYVVAHRVEIIGD